MFLLSCKDEGRNCGCEPAYPTLYKLRGDYFDKVAVLMNKDKTAIIGYPGLRDAAADTACHALKLIDGYCLDFNCSYGINSAYLSITRKEFAEKIYHIGSDSLKFFILDKDPYLEYYRLYYSPPCDSARYDTACMNELIRKGRIDWYFERIK
jgi:hypothetical protein